MFSIVEVWKSFLPFIRELFSKTHQTISLFVICNKCNMSLSGSSNKLRNVGSSQLSCRLRSQLESAVSKNKNTHGRTPNNQSTPSKTSTNMTPTTNICRICKGCDDLREMNLNDAVQKFGEKIEAYQELTKSLGENNSVLSHGLDTIKHFISHTKPKDVNNFFVQTNNKIGALEEYIHDLSKHITKLDNIEEIVNTKISNITSTFGSPHKSDEINKRISGLESLCNQLNSKLDSHSPWHPYEATNASINDFSRRNINESLTPSSSHITSTPALNPRTCLILGDSNTKYVKLDDSHLNSRRLPTYLMEDIDPSTCIGYKKIWVHVGTNNMKSINCENTNDIHGHFNLLMQKLNTIRSLCPYSKMIVSPVLPTAIPTINKRALIFNRLLFSQRNWFTTLDFNLFCGHDGNLMNIYRCYNNRNDRIYLGSLGMSILSSKARHHLSQLDIRSYATAVKNYW